MSFMFRSLLLMALAITTIGSARAVNLDYHPSLNLSQVRDFLNNPKSAFAARYGLTDSAGNSMDAISITQIAGQQYKYAAVYHTAYQVSGKTRYRVNLALSNDLMSWFYQGVLVDNASMPKIDHVSGSEWIVVTHEQWQGAGPGSKSPSRVAFELFYDASDLVNHIIRSTSLMPQWQNSLNGTPSIYEFHLALYNGRYSVDGQYGFHFWNGSRDVNGVTTIRQMFDPNGGTVFSPSTANAYNNLMMAQGVTGNIGDRDTIITSDARYNVQEGNLGQPAGSFDLWRLFLYSFGDANNYPTGNGSIFQLSPQTPNGSTSFGNPRITIVDNPAGTGKAFVVSYFLFGEQAGQGESGSLIYYYNL
jgi:hypothetical protein